MEQPSEEILARLSQAIDALDEQIVRTHDALTTSPEENGQAPQEAGADRALAEELRQRLASEEALRRAAEEKAAALEGELRACHAALEAASAESQSRIAQMARELDDARGALQKESAQVRRIEGEKQRLEQLLAAAQEEAQQWQDRAEDARDDMDAAEAHVAALEAKLAESHTECTRWHSEAQQAWTQIAAFEKERSKILEAKSQAESDSREAAMRLRELELETESLKAELEAVQDAAEPRQAEAQVSAEPEFRARDDKGRRRRFGDVLVDAGVLTEAQAAEIVREQSMNPHRKFGTLVVELGYSSEDVVARVLAAQLGLTYSELNEDEVHGKAAAMIPAHLALQHMCVPIRREGDTLVVAMANPMDLIAVENIELSTSLRVEPVVAKPASIRFVIDRYCPGA